MTEKDKPYTLLLGDCREQMRTLADNSVDAIVTDPPYALTGASGSGGFMGSKWDSELPTVEMWKEALRVAKPGAHLLAFGGTRTYHRLACAIEDAGWEIRDCIMWVYGCLSDDTEIATPEGWKRRGEIKVGDMVIAFDRAYGKTLSQPVQRVFDYDYDDEAYNIISPLTNQLVSKNHRILAEVSGALDFVYADSLNENDTLRVPVYCGNSRLSDFGVFIGHHEMTTASVSLTHYKGRMWCVSVPAGAIVARRNGKIFATGNSGFPKSMDVAKAIDKASGYEGEVIGSRIVDVGMQGGNMHAGRSSNLQEISVRAASAAAQPWQGFGTCLKPAVEPIVVARKPLEGTVAANVLKYGTGAINIDACRVPTENESVSNHSRSAESAVSKGKYGDSTAQETHQTAGQQLGRFPANLIHDGSPEVLACFPESKGQCGAVKGNEPSELTRGIYGKFTGDRTPCAPRGDSGSAARFFYCAKASRSERGDFNDHMTVKPLALMRYLVRLVTRKGGIVLDPFMGSGTTGVAARQLDRPFIGIEREPHYYEIAQRRVLGEVPQVDSPEKKPVPKQDGPNTSQMCDGYPTDPKPIQGELF